MKKYLPIKIPITTSDTAAVALMKGGCANKDAPEEKIPFNFSIKDS